MFHAVKEVRNELGLLFNPPPSAQQSLVAFAKKSPELKMGYNEAEVINDMKLVGMKELRAVASFTIKKEFLSSKLQKELDAKGVPADIRDGIVEGVEGVSKYANSMEDFFVDSQGSAKIFKATVMMKEDPEAPEKIQLAMAVSGAKFEAAQVVSHYEEEKVPVYEREEVIETHTESGLLGDYKVLKTVQRNKYVGDKVKKIPILKQHTFTKGKLETVQRFLEGKTLDQVKLLYGSDEQQKELCFAFETMRWPPWANKTVVACGY